MTQVPPRDTPVVTIDGPSGSGKGTLAVRLAEKIGWHLLDSGALYRIVGAVALERGVLPAADNQDEPLSGQRLAALAQSLDIRFHDGQVLVDGQDLTLRIRHEDVSDAASRVAALEPVRAAILDVQRDFARPPGLVADGRDMGTVVFTDAPVKFYLDASAQVRADRRYKQLKNKGLSVSFRALLESIRERDARDKGRAIAPLRPADDPIVIDSTQMSEQEVFVRVLEAVQAAGLIDAQT